ncbi:MAG: hypothetical protein ACWGHO_04585 [Candidatus Moraniibacteriota bacterium]
MNNAIELIKKQLEELGKFKEDQSINGHNQEFKIWHQVTKKIIEKKFDAKALKDFSYIYYFPMIMTVGKIPDFKKRESFEKGLNSAEAFLIGLLRELEIFGELDEVLIETKTGRENKTTSNGIHLIINNAQSNQQTVNITATFNQITDIINESNKSEDEKAEAKEKINELKEEIEKQSPNWEKIKSILHWLLDFSQKVFLKILPFLLEKYN